MREIIQSDLRHALIMGMSTGGNALLSFCAGIILVRALPTEEYGLVSAAVAVMLVAQELVGRGINDGMVRLGTDAAAGSGERAVAVFRAGFLLKCLFGAAVSFFLLVFPETVARLFGFSKLREAFPAIAAAIAGFGLWGVVLSWYQARMAFTRLALVQPICNMTRIVLYMLAIAAADLAWLPALWIMAGSFFIASALAGTELWRALISPIFHRERFRAALADLWRCTGWNMLAAVAFVTLSRMDIFILTHYVAASEVGLYNAAWQVLTIIDLGTMAIMTVMIPKVSNCRHSGEILQGAGRTIILGMAAAFLSLPLLVFADWYVPLFLGRDYLPSAPLVKIMYWGNILGLVFFPLIGILYARNAFHINAAIQVVLLAVSVPAYAFAAQNGGITGAAWINFGLRGANAALIGATVLFLLRRASRRNTLLAGAIAAAHPPLRDLP